MLGVVVLDTSRLPLKFCWTDAYLLLSAEHLVAVALPQRLHCVTYIESLGEVFVVAKGVDWLRTIKAASFRIEWLAKAEGSASTCGHLSIIIISFFWQYAGLQKECIV